MLQCRCCVERAWPEGSQAQPRLRLHLPPYAEPIFCEVVLCRNQAGPRPEPSSKVPPLLYSLHISLCCQTGTKLIPSRNQGSDCSHSFAKRKFQIMLPSWNQDDPRAGPSSKCYHSHTVCSLSLAAPSPFIIRRLLALARACNKFGGIDPECAW